MARYPEFRQLSALSAYKSDGTPVLATLDATNGAGVTLGASTYLFPFGGERYGTVVETVIHSLSARWPSGIVGVITIEGTNFPRTVTGADQGPADITDWDTTSNAWQLIDPSQAGAIWAKGSGTGALANYTCTITAGAGGAFWNMPGNGAMRLRAKAVLSVGGFVRLFGHGKLGS